jgi:general stress protein CsbA
MEEEIKVKNPTLHRYLFTVTTFSKLLAMALFIVLPFAGFYLGMKYQEKVSVGIPVVSEVKKTIVPTSPLSATTRPLQLYQIVKRLFDPSKIFSNEFGVYFDGKNPKDAITFSDEQLVGLKCYSFTNINYQSKQWWSQVNDPRVALLAQKISELAPNGKKFNLSNFCDITDQNKTFLTYSQTTDPYDVKTLKYTVAIVTGEIINEVTTIDASTSYPGCTPLEVTKNMDLYIDCSGGDGSAGRDVIYKVNLDSKKLDTLLTCNSISGVPANSSAPKDFPINGTIISCK